MCVWQRSRASEHLSTSVFTHVARVLLNTSKVATYSQSLLKPTRHFRRAPPSFLFFKSHNKVEKILTFPGSSLDRGTLRKHLFKDKLCRIEFCRGREKKEEKKRKRREYYEVVTKWHHFYTFSLNKQTVICWLYYSYFLNLLSFYSKDWRIWEKSELCDNINSNDGYTFAPQFLLFFFLFLLHIPTRRRINMHR